MDVALDFETIEHIMIPIATGVIGGLVAWLKMRSDAQKAQIDRLASQRDDRRDDFDSLVKQQAETIKRLDERVKRLEDELDAKDKLLDSLRSDVGRFKLVYQLMRRAVLTECGKADCPLWRYLDDKERDEMLDSLLGEKSPQAKG